MWSAPYDLRIDAARADALFASALQGSEEPSAVQIKQAIVATTRAFGDLGCAARVAQEYGEHPETAIPRMRWARTAVAGAFGDPGAACQRPPGIRAGQPRSPRSRPAATCA
jgi:hypothetical protein